MLCERLGIPQGAVTLLPLIQKDFAYIVQSADVLIMNYPNTEHSRSFMSPTKQFAYMASDRLVIASDPPTVRDIADDSMILFANPNSDETLCSQLEIALMMDNEKTKFMTMRSRERVKYFEWTERAKRILATVL